MFRLFKALQHVLPNLYLLKIHSQYFYFLFLGPLKSGPFPENLSCFWKSKEEYSESYLLQKYRYTCVFRTSTINEQHNFGCPMWHLDVESLILFLNVKKFFHLLRLSQRFDNLSSFNTQRLTQLLRNEKSDIHVLYELTHPRLCETIYDRPIIHYPTW